MSLDLDGLLESCIIHTVWASEGPAVHPLSLAVVEMVCGTCCVDYPVPGSGTDKTATLPFRPGFVMGRHAPVDVLMMLVDETFDNI